MTTQTDPWSRRSDARAEISALRPTYFRGFDEGEEDTFMSVWFEDSEYFSPPATEGEPPFNYPIPFVPSARGLDGIRERFWLMRAEVLGTRHYGSNFVLTWDPESPDRARGQSECLVMRFEADGAGALIGAAFADQYERREGRWGIRECRISFRFRVPFGNVVGA